MRQSLVCLFRNKTGWTCLFEMKLKLLVYHYIYRKNKELDTKLLYCILDFYFLLQTKQIFNSKHYFLKCLLLSRSISRKNKFWTPQILSHYSSMTIWFCVLYIVLWRIFWYHDNDFSNFHIYWTHIYHKSV